MSLLVFWPVLSEACQAPKLTNVRFFPTHIPPSVKYRDLVKSKVILASFYKNGVSTSGHRSATIGRKLVQIFRKSIISILSQDSVCACLKNL